jgi:hypothetical protein
MIQNEHGPRKLLFRRKEGLGMRRLFHSGLLKLLVLVGVSLLPGIGRAAMIKLSLEQLIAQADIIVQGIVVYQESAWNDQHTAIYTDVTLAVEGAVKGLPGLEVTFRVAGGIVGDIGMRTSNDPVFQVGEQVLVFLDTKGAMASVVGLRQGKYTVTGGTITRNGQTMAVDDFVSAIRAAAQK